MNVNGFIKESGFKVLAMAGLSRCEYSVILYLLNTAVSGLDQFITTEAELASLIGVDEDTLSETLSHLLDKKIISIRHRESKNPKNAPSLRIGIEYNLKKWNLGEEKQVNAKDAIVFPFRRQTGVNFQILEGERDDEEKSSTAGPTWQRVMSSFVEGRSLDEEEILNTEETARILVSTHPVDQVLLMIRHFGQRIPTLSLLASSWHHYQEIFVEETQKVDMLGARQKHVETDQKVRDSAADLLSKIDELGLTEEEATVLQILTTHRHPRRQLFWAYQLRSRYPHLEDFFTTNASMMLGVTTAGAVVKPPKDPK